MSTNTIVKDVIDGKEAELNALEKQHLSLLSRFWRSLFSVRGQLIWHTSSGVTIFQMTVGKKLLAWITSCWPAIVTWAGKAWAGGLALITGLFAPV